LLLWLLKKIVMKIFANRSLESLGKKSWVPIAMLWLNFISKVFFRFILYLKNSWIYSGFHFIWIIIIFERSQIRMKN
jgi:hypothetical protein